MANDDILSKVISDAGYSGPRVLQQANEQNCKADLRARTAEAKTVGINGVPSYRVFRRKQAQGDGEWKQIGDIVWGQDLITDVEDYIAGWDGVTTGDAGARSISSKL